MATLGLFLFLTLPLLAQVDPIPTSASIFYRSSTAEFAATGNFQAPVTGRTFYSWSVAAVIGANIADAATSWRAREANPIVGSGGAEFGLSSLAIKSGLVAASLLVQHVALRHRPDWYRRMAWVNVGTSGVLSQVALHNSNVR